jgi:Protein of unknown function (DUF2950)
MATHVRDARVLLLGVLMVVAMLVAAAPARAQEARAFKTPEDAVQALAAATKASDMDALLTLFGPEGKELAASSDPATGRQNRDVFVVAMQEGWRLVQVSADRRELVIGNESWPFPVPIVKTPKGWAFDGAAGREEVLIRRIGRNELAAIRIAGTYVTAQRLYARRGHDGKPAGLYARRLASDPGTENGLYWEVKRGGPHSPLGPLVAEAAAEGRAINTSPKPPIPFHGYYFRILERQGPAAPGGARNYVVGGEMSGGFALVAWPAEYDVTGIMTFLVGPDGVVFEKDLGAETAKLATAMTAFDPDTTWKKAEPPEEP